MKGYQGKLFFYTLCTIKLQFSLSYSSLKLKKIHVKNTLFWILIISFIYSCDSNKVIEVNKAFYYWKSGNWSLDNESEKILEETQTQKLYVKFFEIENNELMGNIPVSKNKMRIYKKDIEIIPTIFIRNEVFKLSTKAEIDLLAHNTNTLIEKYIDDLYSGFELNEFQFDCDWTITTKENYFYFLNKIKGLTTKKLSCTLRLYPYKFRDKMGIPPVDKVMLMCYNLLNPLENKGKNSILDVEELGKYLNVGNNYPLQLDIALPIYSWIQIYQNNQFVGLEYNEIEKVLSKSSKIDSFWYQVNKDVVLDNYYLRVGDKIKYENINETTINQSIQLLRDKINLGKTITVSFFHLDANQLQLFSNEKINSFYTSFSN